MPVGFLLVGMRHVEQLRFAEMRPCDLQPHEEDHARNHTGWTSPERRPDLRRRCCDEAGKPVIGLEIHAQLSTKSKIFSGSATAYGKGPNTQANLVDLAYPGVLPVLNGEVVRMAVKFGAGGRCPGSAAFGVRAQELLLPGPAQGLPDQPVRPAGRARAGSIDIVLATARRSVSASPRPHGRGRRQDAARGPPTAVRHRPQPRRHAAARNRHRAGHAHGRRGRRLSQELHSWSATSASATATCRKALPLRRQRHRAPLGAEKSARAPRSRTSTRSASSRRPSSTKSPARSR